MRDTVRRRVSFSLRRLIPMRLELTPLECSALFPILRQAQKISRNVSNHRTFRDEAKLVANGSTVTLMVTDLESAILVPLCSAQDMGEWSIKLEPLLKFVAFGKAAPLTIEVGETITLRVGSSTGSAIGNSPAADWPMWPLATQVPATVLGAATYLGAKLREELSYVLPAAARELGRFAMNGVCFDVLDQKIQLVATDGRRCAMAALATTLEELPKSTVLERLPAQILAALPGSVISMRWLQGQLGSLLTFEAEGWTLCARAVEGDFPRYRAVTSMPASRCTTVQVRAAELLSVLDGLLPGIDEKKKDFVTHTICNGDVRLVTKSSEGHVTRVRPGGDVTFALRADFFRDAVKAHGKEVDEISIEVVDGKSPVRLMNPLEPSRCYVVMPVVSE